MTGTVVRGGYGLFSALNQGSTYYAMRVENGVVQLNYSYSRMRVKRRRQRANESAVHRPRRRPRPSCSIPNVPFQPSGPPLSSALYPTGGTAPAITGPAATPGRIASTAWIRTSFRHWRTR